MFQARPESGLSFAQIDAILELQLHRLTRLSVDEILKELAEIRELIAELKSILASEKKLKAVIIDGAARDPESPTPILAAPRSSRASRRSSSKT